MTMTRQVPAHARSHACTRTVHVANSHFRATNAYRAWCALQDEWMRTVFQPQQYAQAPHQPYQQPQQQQMPREGPHANDLYASTNSIGSDGALSVLSNADDFSFDPSMVPREWYEQQQQYEIVEVQRPVPQHFEMPAYQQPMQPMYRQEAHPVQYMDLQPMPYVQQAQQQPPVEYVQQPMPQVPVVATIGIALWQQGRYFVIASITPGSDAARTLKVMHDPLGFQNLRPALKSVDSSDQ